MDACLNFFWISGIFPKKNKKQIDFWWIYKIPEIKLCMPIWTSWASIFCFFACIFHYFQKNTENTLPVYNPTSYLSSVCLQIPAEIVFAAVYVLQISLMPTTNFSESFYSDTNCNFWFMWTIYE